ncbi:protein BIG GRAIN 1-like E [Musa acuminata AAA Group]
MSHRHACVESLALLITSHCLRITTNDQRYYVGTAPYNKEVSSHCLQPIPMHGVDACMSSLMSGKGFSSMNHRYRERFNSWNESDELGVFEATRYFSDATDGVGLVGGFGPRGAVAVEQTVPRSSDGRLISGSPSLTRAKKCGKQPGSPGAKLVGYLNSFFHQAASRRKPKCSNPTSTSREPREDGEEVEKRPGDQKERRRSITGHSQSTKTAGTKSSNFCPRSEVRGRRRSITEVSKERENWENKQVPNGAWPRGRNKTFGRTGKEVEDDDGDSDSSSDLFELKICDRGGLSDGLPVFATTDIQAIKRDTAISSSAS